MSTTFLPSYSVGPDAYEEIGFVTKFYGKTVAVVGGETALKKASPRLLPALEKAGLAVSCVEVYGKDATRANVEKIRTNPAVAQADMIFGVGGIITPFVGIKIIDLLISPLLIAIGL